MSRCPDLTIGFEKPIPLPFEWSTANTPRDSSRPLHLDEIGPRERATGQRLTTLRIRLPGVRAHRILDRQLDAQRVLASRISKNRPRRHAHVPSTDTDRAAVSVVDALR